MRRVLLAILIGLTACDEGADTVDLAPADAWAPATPVPGVLRRLTRDQYRLAMADLVGEAVAIPDATGPDVQLGGLFAVGAAGSPYAPRAVEALTDAAETVAMTAVQDADFRARWVTCAPAQAACRAQVLDAFGRRAWRRPLTDAERGRLAAIATAAANALDDPWEALGFGLAAVLQSPHFLYRVELGPPDGGRTRALDPFELATRLSFLLWNAPPDAALLDAAEQGVLATDDGLRVQAERLLDDPRAAQGIRAFWDDVLELHALSSLSKDPTIFEAASDQLGPDAREEALRTLAWWSLDADADVRNALTEPETFLNPRLAALYGVPTPDPDGWRQVRLPPEANRVGLLGQAAFLASHAHAVSSSATLRGKAVRTRLLCQEIPAPPVDVDTSIPEPSGTAPTLRDRVAEHLENPACAACHQLTDPIGLGLENYDGVGAWRVTDNGAPIDATGDLDDVRFDGPIALGQVVADHPDFLPCVVRSLTRYARGTVEAEREALWIDTLNARFGHHGQRLRPLLLELVMSPLFRRVGAPGEAE